jgi:hypothetical protein
VSTPCVGADSSSSVSGSFSGSLIVGQHVEQDGAVLVDLDDVVARQGRMVDAADADLPAAGLHRLAIADLEAEAVVTDETGRRREAEAAVGAKHQRAVIRNVIEGEGQRVAVGVCRDEHADEYLALRGDELLQRHGRRVVDRRDLQGHGGHAGLQCPVAQA